MSQFSISNGTFEGPLETLLDLIEERKLSISDVSLAQVTDAYIAYVENLPELPLGETAQFILIASTLLLIKSRSLLPALLLSEEERESVQELERRLARYAIVRRAARLLRKEWGRAPLLLPRRAPIAEPVFVAGSISMSCIADAALRLVRLLPKPEEMAKAAVAPILILEDVIRELNGRLSSAFRASFRELTRTRDKGEVIVFFLAMLELVRSGSVSATQKELFSDITLEADTVSAPKYGV